MLLTSLPDGHAHSGAAGRMEGPPAEEVAGPAPAVDPAWWSQAFESIRRAEYAPSPTETGFQAPNRAHNLRASFREGGLDVGPRIPGSGAWRWSWRTAAWGRGGDLVVLAPAAPRVAGSRIAYVHSGVIEWYENREEGLEQGFTIMDRPAGEGLLTIEGRITAPSDARPTRDGGGIDFVDPEGRLILRYGGLHVVDASGREVPSRLRTEGSAIRILIDDGDAAYPLHVDPVMTNPAWIGDAGATDWGFGTSVSTAGDVNGDGFSDIVVGAVWYDNGQASEGAAFVYHGSPAGLSPGPDWTGEGNQADAQYGIAVSTAGDVNADGYDDVLVGAWGYDNGQNLEGRAFLYLGGPTGLGPVAAWTGESNVADGRFGAAVGTAGDVNGDGYADVIIGAEGFANGQSFEGAAYVYLGSAGGLSANPTWMIEGNQTNARYGSAVGTAGDVNGDGYSDVIVGAPLASNGQATEGRAFVYHGSAAGPSLASNWSGESDEASALFGISVGTAGDVNGDGYSDIIVGARDYGAGDEGRVYVYHGSAAGLSVAADWFITGSQADAGFAGAVATAGDVNADGYADVIVGAHSYDGAYLNAGLALVYMGSQSGLAAFPDWTGSGDRDWAGFGRSVGTAGDVNGDGMSDVLVGAPDDPVLAGGRAYVYHGSGAGPVSSVSWMTDGGQAGSSLGHSVSSAGDVNGDGYSDVIVGAWSYDGGQVDEGAAFAFHGSATGLSVIPEWSAEGDQAGAGFGTSVSGAGDVNGDGYSDVIVGVHLYANGEAGEGAAFAFHGSAAGLSATPDWTSEGDQAGARYGFSVSTAGDVDGDGYSDVIVGSLTWDGAQNSAGAAFVFHGSAAGLSATHDWMAEGNSTGVQFGQSVSTAGDIDGDGYSDIIVGAPWDSNGQANEGRAFVYHGSAAGLPAAPAWTGESNQAGARFGVSASCAGDVNGDGYGDVIVGADGYDLGAGLDRGRAYVFHGSAAGLSAGANWTADGDQDGGALGGAVGPAGDVNGDGYSDVMVGAPLQDDDADDGGFVWVYRGSSSGIQIPHIWAEFGPDEDGHFGSSVSTAGDVNGDGFDDILIGAEGQGTGGQALVYHGNQRMDSYGGVALVPRQRKTDGEPIDILGASDATDRFFLLARGRTPAGRERVRIEWSIDELGMPLSGAPLIRGSWNDTGAPLAGLGSATPLEEISGVLMEATSYHWRLRVGSASPYFPHSPWMSMASTVPSMKQMRTADLSTDAPPSVARAPSRLRLESVRPNPATPRTALVYALPARGRVLLEIHDASGRRVATLVDGVREPGRHVASWDGRDAAGSQAAAGVYFARLAADEEVLSAKLVLAR